MSQVHRMKHIIGWSESVDFPDWGIRKLPVKVDTGARTSALHVENLERLPGQRVRFDVMIGRRKPFRRRHITARVAKWAKVRSSNGHYTERCFIRCRIVLGAVDKTIEISLVSREKMLFRMLLGRKALEHDFVVDVSRRAVLRRRKAPDGESAHS